MLSKNDTWHGGLGQTVAACLALAASACSREAPPTWDGPTLGEVRDQLTVAQLTTPDTLPMLDMSYFTRPAWAGPPGQGLSGTLTLAESDLEFPLDRAPYPGELVFPAFTVDLILHGEDLLPRQRGRIDTSAGGDSLWDVIVGTGRAWKEPGDDGWSRASFPLSLTDRYMGQVRNCVATFTWLDDETSNAWVQCSQETADLDDRQLGDIRAMVPATFTRREFADAGQVVAGHARRQSGRIPVLPLRDFDRDGKIAEYFGKTLWTNAPTSLGAIWVDGALYLHPPMTRHGAYPYPEEMRHGVYSVTKSLAGALALFHFAQRYGEGIFDARIADHVPELADAPGWQGVTFAHALDMATGTRGGESADLMFEPLVTAPDTRSAIANIAALGDATPAPGEAFHYATTNTFVLSYALQRYVESREGEGVRYWDLVREDVLRPIGAEDFLVLHTREEDASRRIPYLGYGALPTLDAAAKIALLIANEGRHEGRQLLHADKVREALGRTAWRGYPVNRSLDYRHSFWSMNVQASGCDVPVSIMQGHGGNHVLFAPADVIVIHFMDEQDMDFAPLVRSIGRLRNLCD